MELISQSMHYQPLLYMSSGQELSKLKGCKFIKNMFSSFNFHMHIFNVSEHRTTKWDTLAILILQSMFYYQTFIFRWLRCDAYLITIRQKLHKLFSKNLQMLMEGRNNGKMDRLKTVYPLNYVCGGGGV